MSRSLRHLWFLALCSLAHVSSGCVFMWPARAPMHSERRALLGPTRARGVIVLLPGFGDRASTFAAHGFLDVLARRAPDYDVVATDAHFGYYRTRTLLGRLDADVIGPLRARGYREIWLSGVSLGGHGAIAYARSHPERITGLLLFAPYMGKAHVVEEVRRAGGLCRYQTQPHYPDDEDGFARANLAWLKREACAQPPGVSLWFGVGSEDKLRPASELVTGHLERSHSVILPGGHGFRVWTPALDVIAGRAFSAGR